MDDSTKIQHLKSGIKLDAGLEHAMTTARTNKLAAGDFQGYVSFMSAEVDIKSQRLKQLSSSRSRMISGLRGGFRGGGARGGYGRRNGGRGGRGGRGDHNSTNLGPHLKATVDGKVVESKRYSYQEFQNFNANQRNKIIQLHKERKAKASSTYNTRDDTMSIKSVGLITNSISEAIVAGVKQATQSNESDTVSEVTQATKRKAESGSVGSFIKQRRNNTSGANGDDG